MLLNPVTSLKPIPESLDPKTFISAGSQPEGLKGVLAAVPNTDRLLYITQLHHPSLHRQPHSVLLMRDSAGLMSRDNRDIKKSLSKLQPELQNNPYIGGYRAHFEQGQAGQPLTVTIDKSEAFGPISSKIEKGNNHLDEGMQFAAADLVKTFRRQFPETPLTFVAKDNSSMEQFVEALNQAYSEVIAASE